MVQDEAHFVRKVVRLIRWARPPGGHLAGAKWWLTPPKRRPLPGWMASFKRDWWDVYRRGGEAAVRDYYRTVYTLTNDRRRNAVSDGHLIEDPSFALWARTRYRIEP